MSKWQLRVYSGDEIMSGDHAPASPGTSCDLRGVAACRDVACHTIWQKVTLPNLTDLEGALLVADHSL